MRHPTKNQPSIQEMMAADPAFAAVVRAIQRDAREQDRHDRQHSFVCRHYGLSFGTGLLMAFGPVFAMLAIAGSVDFGSPSGVSLLSKLMIVSAAGFLLVLFCAARPGSKNWATALGKEMFVIGMFLAVAIPMMGGFDAVLNHIAGG